MTATKKAREWWVILGPLTGLVVGVYASPQSVRLGYQTFETRREAVDHAVATNRPAWVFRDVVHVREVLPKRRRKERT